MFPFSLQDRIHIPPDDVQRWLAVMLAVYGAGLLFASREFHILNSIPCVEGWLVEQSVVGGGVAIAGWIAGEIQNLLGRRFDGGGMLR